MTTYTIDARSEIDRLSARVTRLEEIIANLATSVMAASIISRDADLWPGAMLWAYDVGEKLIVNENSPSQVSELLIAAVQKAEGSDT